MAQLRFLNSSKEDKWKDEWQNMPEFIQENNNAYKTIIIRFSTEQDYKDFAKLINQKLTSKTKSIWFPKLIRGTGCNIHKRYFIEEK